MNSKTFLNFFRFFQAFLVLIFSIGLVLQILPNFGLPVNSFGANFTNNISIFQKTENERIVLDYYILQTFQSRSRGIFLTLPKNQDGN